MEVLFLALPTAEYTDEINTYRAEFAAAGDSTDGCAGLDRIDDTAQWLAHVASLRDAETCPAGMAVSTLFLYVRAADRRVVGMIDLRHTLNNGYLARFGGHIGYSVRPSERRRGYAHRMLAAALPYCRVLGLSQVLITCTSVNAASRRVILGAGGCFAGSEFSVEEGETVERYWVKLPQPQEICPDPGVLCDGDICLVPVNIVPADPVRDWFTACHFAICSSAGERMGECDLRLGHNANTYYGGNIGYRIEMPFRGRHYAARACRLLLALALQYGMGYVIVTCNPDNIASRKTCLRAGGILDGIMPLPPDNEMYIEGEREKCIFRFPLDNNLQEK